MSLLDDSLQSFIADHATIDDVYALAVVLGAEQRSVTFAIAHEGWFEQQSDSSRGFYSVRWNPGDFPEMDTVQLSTTLDEAVAVIDGASFDGLQTTTDFVSFVAQFDQSETDRKAWMRRTISEPLFEVLFPAVAEFESFLDLLAAKPTDEQIDYWATVMEDLMLRRGTPPARQMELMQRSVYDAERALVEIGAAAVPRLLEIASRHADAPAHFPAGSPEREEYGAATFEAKLRSLALSAVRDIGADDAETLRALQALLGRYVSADPGSGLVGPDAAIVARLLHRLDDVRFPKPETDPSTNRLLNPNRYLDVAA